MTHGTRLAENAPVAGIILGGLLLAFGRALFWLFVAISGFVAGIFLAERFLGGQSQAVTLVIGAVAGLLGAVLAIFLQKLAVGIAGFFAGGYIAADIAGMLGWANPQFTWVLFAAGGIVGALLVVGLFDWALILLSSLMGASLITQGIHPAASIAVLLDLGLFVFGIILQAGLRRRARPASDRQ